MSAQTKRFRIEDLGNFDSRPVLQDYDTELKPSSVDMILTEIRELRQLVKPAGKVTIDIVDAYRREISEVMKLRTDLQDIERAINDTRKEMASLHVGAPSTVGMDQLSGELGAVVSQTEAAANTILNSAEAISNELFAVRNQIAEGKEINGSLDTMDTEISKLFEACHFQDLTGQRISRVCDTLSFIENQISRLTNIWGGLQAIDHLLAAEVLAKAQEEETIGDHALANGPQLMAEEIGHVNQLEIDSLFN
jgi:chemotaxis protein CheZ